MSYEFFTDWRVRPASTLAKDVPDEGPGKPAHKAGAAVVAVNLLKAKRGDRIIHPAFIPIALSLDLAMSHADAALQAQAAIAYDERTNGKGIDRLVHYESTDDVLAYFEHGMVSATFSMQAIEMFCNDAITRNVAGTHRIGEGAAAKEFTAAGLQRAYSTEEKLALILPRLLGIARPDKGRELWSGFKLLNRVRNDVIHFKGERQQHARSLHNPMDDTSLWYDLWNIDVERFPRCAVAMIAHFTPAADVPQWLQHCLDRYRIAPGPSWRRRHLSTP